MAIAESLKRFRRKYNLSQKVVAEKIGMKQQTYSQYEFDFKGKPVTPSIDVVAKIAKEFNVSIDYLAGLTDEPRPLIVEKSVTNAENQNENELQSLKADNQFLKEQLAKIAEKVDKLAS